jgi:hypothetical protein
LADPVQDRALMPSEIEELAWLVDEGMSVLGPMRDEDPGQDPRETFEWLSGLPVETLARMLLAVRVLDGVPHDPAQVPEPRETSEAMAALRAAFLEYRRHHADPTQPDPFRK